MPSISVRGHRAIHSYARYETDSEAWARARADGTAQAYNAVFRAIDRSSGDIRSEVIGVLVTSGWQPEPGVEEILHRWRMAARRLGHVPFPDEIRPIRVVPYQLNWAADFQTLAGDLWALRLADRGIIEHVGSTSVPGLAAKDVIDLQLRVPALDPNPMSASLGRLGYRRRPEHWNNSEPTRAGPVAKLVFAPPVGSRPCNVHVRVHDSQGARDTLLFRDFLRSEPAMRDAWGILKTAAASLTAVEDLAAYSRIKDPAWQVLMYGADRWAEQQSWKPKALLEWR